MNEDAAAVEARTEEVHSIRESRDRLYAKSQIFRKARAGREPGHVAEPIRRSVTTA